MVNEVRKEHIIDFTRINPIYPTHELIRLSCPVLDSYHLRPRTFFFFSCRGFRNLYPINVHIVILRLSTWVKSRMLSLLCCGWNSAPQTHEFLSCKARGTCHDSRWWRGVWLMTEEQRACDYARTTRSFKLEYKRYSLKYKARCQSQRSPVKRILQWIGTEPTTPTCNILYPSWFINCKILEAYQFRFFGPRHKLFEGPSLRESVYFFGTFATVHRPDLDVKT